MNTNKKVLKVYNWLGEVDGEFFDEAMDILFKYVDLINMDEIRTSKDLLQIFNLNDRKNLATIVSDEELLVIPILQISNLLEDARNFAKKHNLEAKF